MYKFFNTCKTIEDVKELYRKLSMQHHPDKGGNIEIMKQINAEYETAFNQFKDTHRNAKGETYIAKEETTETATEYKDIINAIIHLNDIKIELIGCWVWVSGITKPYKDIFNKLHFTFSGQKLAWFWHPEESHKKSHKKFNLDQIRAMYGSEEIKTRTAAALN